MASSTSPTTFTGNSAFTADLQNALSRAVSFASLPLQLIQNKQSDVTNQKSALQSLSSKFQSLQSSVDLLNKSIGTGSYVASVSKDSVATASASSGVTAGSYSLNVTSTGSHTSTMSTDGLTTVSDPSSGNIGSATDYTLTVDGQTFQISNSSGNLNGLARALNASAANVQATVVNVGSSSAPDYRLSVQGNKYAATSIQLSDGTTSLLNTLTTGSNVTYQVNGQTSNVSSDTRSITLSTGLTVNLLQTGSTEINVLQSNSNIASGLSSFVSTYNAAVDELGKSRGKSGGALSGESIVYTLSESLRKITNSGDQSGSVSSISDLGLSFDQNGHLSFDASVLTQATSNSFTNVSNFLGTKSTTGFLKQANDVLTSLTDNISGILPQATQSMTDQLSSLADKLSAGQDRVTLLQQTLTAQMYKADAMISSLEQQASYFTTLFETVRQNKSNG